MTKPVIVTRAGKGSALTWTEGDANVTNLQNATITIKADTAGTDVVSDLNGSITLVAGNNIALTGDNTAKTVTIDAATPNMNLDDLSDVTATGATNGQVLTYNSTMMTWGASSPAGGASQLGDLTDVYFSGPPSDKDLLTFNNTSGKWEPAQLGGIDLLSDVAITAAATGDILYYNGTNWIDQSFSALVGTQTITATTVDITATNTTAATHYITFVNGATGTEEIRSDTGLTYNPSTGVLTSTNFTGSLTGNADTATYASAVTLTSDNTTAATNYPLFANATSGNLSPRTDSGFTYNPSTGVLTTTSLAGNVTGTSIGLTGGTGTAGAGNINFSGSTSSAAWSNLGIQIKGSARTFTDTSTASSLATNAVNSFLTPTLASTNVITITDAATFYINAPAAGTNTTITNAWSVLATGKIKATDFSGTIGATTPAAGTFTTVTASGRTSIKDLTETIATVTYAATITPDVANGTVQKITLTGGVTFSAFANPVAGQSLTLIITQDATGSRTLTSTMKFSGASKTLSTAANSIDILSVFYDGTNYYASLGKGFA